MSKFMGSCPLDVKERFDNTLQSPWWRYCQGCFAVIFVSVCETHQLKICTFICAIAHVAAFFTTDRPRFCAIFGVPACGTPLVQFKISTQWGKKLLMLEDFDMQSNTISGQIQNLQLQHATADSGFVHWSCCSAYQNLPTCPPPQTQPQTRCLQLCVSRWCNQTFSKCYCDWSLTWVTQWIMGRRLPFRLLFSLFYLMDEQSSQSLFDIAPLDSALAISDYWVMSQQ